MGKGTAYWRMTKDRISSGILDDTDKKILEMVRSAPLGINGKEIRERLGMGESSVHARTSALKHAGRICMVGYGRYALWALPGDEERVANELYSKQRAEAASRGPYFLARFDRTHKRREARIDALEASHPLDMYPIQRTVSAKDCERVQIKGPVSVWELAR